VLDRCGWRPKVRQMCPTVARLMPAFLAILRVLQCVRPLGVVSSVFTSTALDLRVGELAGRSDPRLIVQAVKPVIDEAAAPLAHGVVTRPVRAGDRRVGLTVRAPRAIGSSGRAAGKHGPIRFAWAKASTE
jgi:hypothetical protein